MVASCPESVGFGREISIASPEIRRSSQHLTLNGTGVQVPGTNVFQSLELCDCIFDGLLFIRHMEDLHGPLADVVIMSGGIGQVVEKTDAIAGHVAAP
jgi:hypothetical protein